MTDMNWPKAATRIAGLASITAITITAILTIGRMVSGGVEAAVVNCPLTSTEGQ